MPFGDPGGNFAGTGGYGGNFGGYGGASNQSGSGGYGGTGGWGGQFGAGGFTAGLTGAGGMNTNGPGQGAMSQNSVGAGGGYRPGSAYAPKPGPLAGLPPGYTMPFGWQPEFPEQMPPEVASAAFDPRQANYTNNPIGGSYQGGHAVGWGGFGGFGRGVGTANGNNSGQGGGGYQGLLNPRNRQF